MSVMLQRFTDKPNLGASDPSFRYNVFRSPGSLSPLLGSIGLWGGGGGGSLAEAFLGAAGSTMGPWRGMERDGIKVTVTSFVPEAAAETTVGDELASWLCLTSCALHGSTHFNDYVFAEMMDPSIDGQTQFVALRSDRLELRLFQVGVRDERAAKAEPFWGAVKYGAEVPAADLDAVGHPYAVSC